MFRFSGDIKAIVDRGSANWRDEARLQLDEIKALIRFHMFRFSGDVKAIDRYCGAVGHSHPNLSTQIGEIQRG